MTDESQAGKKMEFEQMDLFTDYQALEQKKYGKNAILKGLSYQEGATGKERNRQIGGHKA